MNASLRHPPFTPPDEPSAPELEKRRSIAVDLYTWAGRRVPAFRKLSKLVMYQLMARFAPQPDWTFMNYGYAPAAGEGAPIALQPADEPNRYCIQLYHHVAGAVDIRDRRVLEVGSGRGGGASFIKRYHSPAEMIGADYSRQAVALCRRTYSMPGLTFVHGDAEDLPFDDGSFDAIVNVESSHCYSSMPRFLRQVARLLRPGGHFLFADFRTATDLPQLDRDLHASGLTLLARRDITANVLQALQADHARKLAQIRAGAPRWLVGFFEEFAGAPGSRIHDRFRTADERYLSYTLQKAPT